MINVSKREQFLDGFTLNLPGFNVTENKVEILVENSRSRRPLFSYLNLKHLKHLTFIQLKTYDPDGLKLFY